MSNAQGIQNGKRTLLASCARYMCQPVGNVLLRVEMGKQCEVLKNIANLTFGDGQVEAGHGIEDNAMVHRDAPGIRSGEVSGFPLASSIICGRLIEIPGSILKDTPEALRSPKPVYFAGPMIQTF